MAIDNNWRTGHSITQKTKYSRRFAWLRTIVDNTDTIWLQHYYCCIREYYYGQSKTPFKREADRDMYRISEQEYIIRKLKGEIDA